MYSIQSQEQPFPERFLGSQRTTLSKKKRPINIGQAPKASACEVGKAEKPPYRFTDNNLDQCKTARRAHSLALRIKKTKGKLGGLNEFAKEIGSHPETVEQAWRFHTAKTVVINSLFLKQKFPPPRARSFSREKREQVEHGTYPQGEDCSVSLEVGDAS